MLNTNVSFKLPSHLSSAQKSFIALSCRMTCSFLTKNVDMGEYLNHFFFLPPLNQDGIHNPTTPAHHMMRFVLLSHMSRSFGAIARSEEFISTARQISGQLYDDPSYDSGVAFMLLADICLANGDHRASHYASVAWNHAKVLSRNDWSNIHLQLQSFVMCNMLDASLSPEQKQQQLHTYASQLLDADVLTTIISGLMLKTGAVGLILNGASCKEAGLLNCLKNLTVEYVLFYLPLSSLLISPSPSHSLMFLTHSSDTRSPRQ
jgi:hypothetical protein